MGQAPATGRNSLRTTPRNFPGRSGTSEDSVFLCSPETAAASALFGKITDPRSLGASYPRVISTSAPKHDDLLVPPPPKDVSRRASLIKGANIRSLPHFGALPDTLELPILLKMDDDVSTDEILPAGAKVLPYRSNIQRIDDFTFKQIDPTYLGRARAVRGTSGHAVIAGSNYGQGSSREHAAIAPRNLGLKVVLAKSFARIHRQNLINYGVLPLTFVDPEDYRRLQKGDVLRAADLLRTLKHGDEVELKSRKPIPTRHQLTARQIDVILAGGLINWHLSNLHSAA
jgi:aconitate hydratase